MGPFVEVGYVAKAHGVRGWIRVHCHDETSSALSRAKTVQIGGGEHRVSECRHVSGAFLLRCEGVSSREEAEALRGKSVSVERAALELEDSDVLLVDFVGCKVTESNGLELGLVVEVVVGAQHRLVVRGGGLEREIPLVDELFVEMDVAAGQLVVDLPEDYPTTSVEGEPEEVSSRE